jgi:hypothetical protein
MEKMSEEDAIKQIQKCIDLIYEVIQKNPGFKSDIWFSAFTNIMGMTFSHHGFSYQDFYQSNIDCMKKLESQWGK